MLILVLTNLDLYRTYLTSLQVMKRFTICGSKHTHGVWEITQEVMG